MSPADCLRYLAACAVALRVGVDGDVNWVWRDLREMACALDSGDSDRREAVRERLLTIVSRYDTNTPHSKRVKTRRAGDLYRRALRVAQEAVR